jgi:HEAT repeat protein
MQHLIEQLDDPNPRKRHEAVNDLLSNGAAAFSPLVEALNHEDVEIRWRAVTVLGWMGDPRAISPLVKRAVGEGYEAKVNIVWALGQIGDASAVSPLLEIVHAGETELPDIRYTAALALARLGQAGALRESLVGSPESVYRVANAALAAYEYVT